MAPEQILERPSGKPVDIYACGIILYYLLENGKHPACIAEKNAREEVKRKILSEEFALPLTYSK